MSSKMNQIIAAINDPKIKVVSFDVFDTLVLRPFWKPVDLFMFLDKEASSLFHTADIIRFSEFRKTAEQEARDRSIASGREDLTFTDIYNYLAENSPFPKQILDALMEKEKELELRFCYPRKSTKQLLDAAVAADKKIIAVSDMYLPAGFVMDILKNCGIDSIERIFVSGDVGLAKRSGHLYEYVAQEMGVELNEIVHIGDNAKTDVRVPRKLQMRSFYYPRTINLMSKGNTSRAYRHAYEQFCTSFSNYHAEYELGIRCLLAVAANRVYDNPFQRNRTAGDYAGDAALFGTLALGLYSFAQGMWVYRLATRKDYNHVIFFARDGYLPYLAYEMARKKGNKTVPEASYVRTSRKALLPFLLTKENGPYKTAVHVRYLDHSPKSLTRLMESVLKDNTETILAKEMGKAWEEAFKSETDLVKYMAHLHKNYVDEDKAKAVEKGFVSYFAPLMEGNVLTYDIGYSLRSEIVLREFFKDVHIDACITHGVDDVPIRRGVQGNINVHTFYSSTPFVSWLPREMFLAEHASSCVGYEPDGNPIMEEKADFENILEEMHKHAVAYMEEVTTIFGEDLYWLPLQLPNACQPFDTFLHSPTYADKKWIRYLNADNDAASGLRLYQCYDFWRRLRMDYWAASHHLGKYGRYAAIGIMLLFTDRYDLQKTIKKRLPHKVRKLMKM